LEQNREIALRVGDSKRNGIGQKREEKKSWTKIKDIN
jgi:hypothetical protein